ncbi:hypothetical protein CEQ90_08995 [Lewinellaceae bacterium SD302]|nr:hypothetical protein CEQ90_08995 [Lewinellaceae bacterium SD302]
MIINHAYQFCFFAIPRTASKAISKLLVEEMGSKEIHKMHTSYGEFRQLATPKEKDYFTFATIRNPMDSVVSAYFKKKNDHNGRFSRGTFKGGRPIGAKAMAEYRFIVENDADFSTYFLEFYREPYRIPRHEETARSVQTILRYESLDADFATLAAKKWNRPDLKIPVFNQTAGKSRNFLDYYTPEALERAHFVFGRLMGEWGY